MQKEQHCHTRRLVKRILALWQVGNNLISLTFLPLAQLKQRSPITQDPLQLPKASKYPCKP